MKCSAGAMKKDGHFSWLVLIAITLTNFCCMGFLFGSAGVLSEVFPQLLNKDISVTTAIGSTLSSVFLFSAPFNEILLATVGCRVVAALGSLMTVIGVVSSAFCTKLWHFILGYSIIGGIGMGMILVASINIVPSYFEKRKAAAYSCIGFGESIGLVIFPYILSALLDGYDFKHSMLYISAMFALTILAPITYIPKPELVNTPTGALPLLRSYIKPLRYFISPFYLLNSYCWQGGGMALSLVLFGYITTHSNVAVAVSCFSILGVGSLVSSFLFFIYLLRFHLNHYMLHIAVNLLAGAVVIVVSLVHDNVVYYISFAVFGACLGLIVANMTCVSSHLYDGYEIGFAFGWHQIFGGIGSLVIPMTTGLLQDRYYDRIGLYYIAGHFFLGSLALIIPVVIKPHLWKPKSMLAQDDVDRDAAVSSERQNQIPKEAIDEITQT